ANYGLREIATSLRRKRRMDCIRCTGDFSVPLLREGRAHSWSCVPPACVDGQVISKKICRTGHICPRESRGEEVEPRIGWPYALFARSKMGKTIRHRPRGFYSSG